MLRCFRPDASDLLDVGERLVRRQPARYPRRPAVVGDEDVGVAALRAAAATSASTVWCPSVALVWQWRSPRMSSRSTSAGSRPDCAASISPAVLAQLGRDPRQADGRVDLLLGGAGDPRLPPGSLKTPYSEILRCFLTAISRIRMLCSFEPVKY